MASDRHPRSEARPVGAGAAPHDARRGAAVTGGRTRIIVDAGLLAIVACAALSIVASLDVVRPFAVLAAFCLVPGGAILTRLSVDDPVTGVALAFGLSLTLDVAASLVLVWTGWWHPELLAIVIGAASAVLLLDDLWQAVGGGREPSREAVT